MMSNTRHLCSADNWLLSLDFVHLESFYLESLFLSDNTINCMCFFSISRIKILKIYIGFSFSSQLRSDVQWGFERISSVFADICCVLKSFLTVTNLDNSMKFWLSFAHFICDVIRVNI